MGAAQSSNTAKAVAEISNSIKDITSTTQSQINRVQSEIKLKDCQFGSDVKIKEFYEYAAKSRQITQAFQQSNLQNNIAQKVLQAATSTVGSLGLGYSSSKNYVSTFASSVNDISNAIFTQSNQASFFNNNIACDGSTIHGTYEIDINSATDFWNKQGVKSSQVNDISNSIDQTITQKATSKVEGILGAIIGIIAVIGALAFAILSPISETAGSLSIVIALFVFFGVILLTVWLWLIEFSPFFGKQKECSTSGSLLKGDCASSKCKDAKMQTINLSNPPIKYMYNIIGRGSARTHESYGMLNMCIYSQLDSTSSLFNQGFNAYQCLILGKDGWKADKTYEKYGVPQLPNPLYIPIVCGKDKDEYCLIPKSYIVTKDNNGGENTPSVATYREAIQSISKEDFIKGGKESQLNVIAELNTKEWEDYLEVKGKYSTIKSSSKSIEKVKRALHARYILTTYLAVENNAYIFSKEKTDFDRQGEIDEEIDIGENMMLASEAKKNKMGYQYSNFRTPPMNDYSFSVKGNGSLTGMIGVCDSRSNKAISFFDKTGNNIMLILIVLIFIILFFFVVKKRIQSGKLSQEEIKEE